MKQFTDTQKLIDAIKHFKDKIKTQGMITNARDEEHLMMLEQTLENQIK